MAEPPRQVAHFALPVAAAFLLLASIGASNRPMAVGGLKNVAVMGPTPAGVRAVGPDDWSVFIHRSDWNSPVARLLGRTGEGRGQRLGWIVRQWSAFTLPLVAWRQGDPVIVTEDAAGYRLSGLTVEDERALQASGGAGLFPFWRYGWGLLIPAAIGAAVWLEGRWQARRRALLGLI